MSLDCSLFYFYKKVLEEKKMAFKKSEATLVVSETIREVFSTLNKNKKVTEKSLLKSGFKRGYGVWIMSGDIIPDEDL